MVDPLGTKPVLTSDRKVAALTRVAVPTSAESVTAPLSGRDQPAATITHLTQELSARAPIDHDRVSRIRKAIADGSFPIYPAKIADRLIAFKLEWNPDEQA